MRILPLALIALATPVAAADRAVPLASFDRVRIDAPIAVRIATGASPSAIISGDRDAVEAIEVRLNGTVLTIGRRADRWQERPAAGAVTTPTTVTLGTGALTGIAVIGAGQVEAGRMKAARVDLSVSGPGRIAIAAVEADQASATVIGGGAIAIAGGRVRLARLLTNGPGTIDAAGLDAGDVTIRLDGPGEVHARARLSASVNSTGTGRVTIAGNPKCEVRATGPVACGSGR